MEPKRILIVDDDVEILETLEKRLQHHGFFCDKADSVEAALKIVGERTLDLVLLDLGFPGVDGTAFLKNAFRRMSPQRKIPPVLVLSCYSDKEIVDHVLQSGAVGFVAKPYDAAELVTTIQLLTQSPPAGPAEPAPRV